MDLQAWSKPCFRSFFHTFFCRAKISPVASNHAFGSFPSDPGAVIIQRHFSGQNHTSLAPGPVPQHLMRLPGVSSKQQPFLRWFFSWKMIGKETQETKSIVSLWSLDGDCKVESTCIYIYIIQLYIQKWQNNNILRGHFFYCSSRSLKAQENVQAYCDLCYEAKQLKLWNHQRYPEIRYRFLF